MGFSSVPLYLDPYNWQQQQQSHQQQQQLGGGGGHGSSSQKPQLPLSSAPAGLPVGSIRPGSMSDRARLAKLPMPESGQKCPRCESTNTKFCYFNNYNLLQERHFCKTCRRHWTKGGALRNVPVGGGCRRNKRSSSKTNTASSSKAAINNNDIIIVPTSHQQDEAAPLSSNSNNTGIGFPLLASLQGFNSQNNLGLNFSGGIIQPPQIGTTNDHNQSSILGFHVGSSSSTSNYPNFLAGFEPPLPSSSLYTLHNGDDDDHHQNVEAPPLPSSPIFGGIHHHQLVIRSQEVQNQNAPPDTKDEEAMSQGFNLVSSSRPLRGGVSENNHHQFWDGNSNNAAWPDFSGINNSSSTSTRNNM